MPEPGLYLTNATGETVPVHTEGGQDLQLLAEYIEEHNLLTDLTAISGDVPVPDGGEAIEERPPIEERPEPEEMSVEELREEYQTFDVAGLASGHDNDRWERHLELWRELESRDLVEFPECSREGCDCRRWRFTPGGPASCAECGDPVHDADQSEKVHGAAKRLIYGGETA